MVASAWCPLRPLEWVAAEAPSLPCSWHHDDVLLTFWPPEYRQLGPLAGLDVRRSACTSREVRASRDDREVTSRSGPPRASMTIVSPPDGATYLIDPTLRRKFQTLHVPAITKAQGPTRAAGAAASVQETRQGDPENSLQR